MVTTIIVCQMKAIADTSHLHEIRDRRAIQKREGFRHHMLGKLGVEKMAGSTSATTSSRRSFHHCGGIAGSLDTIWESTER